MHPRDAGIEVVIHAYNAEEWLCRAVVAAGEDVLAERGLVVVESSSTEVRVASGLGEGGAVERMLPRLGL